MKRLTLIFWQGQEQAYASLAELPSRLARDGVANAFRWVGWALLLGGLGHVQSVTDSTLLAFVCLLLALGLWLNIAATCNSFTIVWGDEGTPRKLRSTEVIISALFSLVIALCVGVIAMQTSSAITEFQKELSGQTAEEIGKEL